MNTAVNPTTQTAIAEYNATESALADLRQRFDKAVFNVTTTKGMTEAKAARAELRGLRNRLEEMRQQLKAPVLDRGRLLDSEAKRITAELVALEDPIDSAIKAEEARKEREKEERAEAERQRVAENHRRFEEIRSLVPSAAGKSVDEITALIGQAEAVDPGTFPDDMQSAAKFERQLAINGLKAARDARVEQDREAVETAAKLKRLEELERKEQEREAAARAEEERKATEERERVRAQQEQEARERAEREAAEREELRQRQAAIAEQERVAAAERAEADRKAKEERDRLAAEQRAESDRIAAAARAEAERVAAKQRAEAERQAAERRQLEEEAARLAAEREAREIAGASLLEAANDALPLLEKFCPRHKATKKLAAALAREQDLAA